jgi:uncharacterized protein
MSLGPGIHLLRHESRRRIGNGKKTIRDYPVGQVKKGDWMEPIREGLFELKEDGSGYLLINTCSRCGLSFFPRRKLCIKCLQDDSLKNETLKEGGKLYTYTIVHRAVPDFSIPYMVGYIDFEKEGVRVFSQITACEPEELKIGMEMKLVFEGTAMSDPGKRRMVYKFRPIPSGREERI